MFVTTCTQNDGQTSLEVSGYGEEEGGNSCLLTSKDWVTWIVDVGEWTGGQLTVFISPTELAGGLEFSVCFSWSVEPIFANCALGKECQ